MERQDLGSLTHNSTMNRKHSTHYKTKNMPLRIYERFGGSNLKETSADETKP